MEKLHRLFAALICVLTLLSAQCIAACSVAALSSSSSAHSAPALHQNSHSCCHHHSDSVPSQGMDELACEHAAAPDAETDSGMQISAVSWNAVLLTGNYNTSFSHIFPSLQRENWYPFTPPKSAYSPSALVLRV